MVLAYSQIKYKWNRIESLEIYSHIHDQIISEKVSRPFNEKRTIFSTNGARKTGYQYAIIKLVPYLVPYTKSNLKWIKDRYKSCLSIKLSKKTQGRSSMTLDQAMISSIQHQGHLATTGKVRLDENFKTLCIRRQQQQSKNATHRMGKNICKPCM